MNSKPAARSWSRSHAHDALPVLQKPGAHQVQPLHVGAGEGALSPVHQPGLLLHVQDQREHNESHHGTAPAGGRNRRRAAPEAGADAWPLRLLVPLTLTPKAAAAAAVFLCPALSPSEPFFLASRFVKSRACIRCMDLHAQTTPVTPCSGHGWRASGHLMHPHEMRPTKRAGVAGVALRAEAVEYLNAKVYDECNVRFLWRELC